MFRHTRRFTLFTAAAALASFAAPALAEYPEKPITLVIPYSAGGSTETMGRVFAEALGDALDANVVVRTRPGAGGSIGATEVAAAANDGYTLLFGASDIFTWAPMTSDVTFTRESFDYIAQITEYQMAIVAKADAPFDTMEELIAYAKDNSLNYADQGAISKAMINFIASQEGVEWTGIPTDGGGEAMPFLLGGKVDFTYSGGVHTRYGSDMKVLASLIGNRLASSPDAPSIKDIYGIALPGEAIIAAPAGIPDDVRAKLEAAIATAAEDETFKTLLVENLQFPLTLKNSADTTAMIAEIETGLKALLEATQ